MSIEKSIWSPCREYPDIKHNHVLCECPACQQDVERYYRCVLNNKYLERDYDKSIPSVGGSIEDQPWL